MLTIHPSHTRKDLIEICEVFNIELEDIHDMSKNDLVLSLESGLDAIDYIDPEDQFYHIGNLDELKNYLEQPNQTKCLSIVEREKIIIMSRNILIYCKSGFHIGTIFRDLESLKRTAEQVAEHCDLSTCRRAIKNLSLDKKIDPPIQPVLSNKMKRKLHRKEQLKKEGVGKLHVKHGKVLVVFD